MLQLQSWTLNNQILNLNPLSQWNKISLNTIDKNLNG